MKKVALRADSRCLTCKGKGLEAVYVDGGTRRVICTCVRTEEEMLASWRDNITEACEVLRHEVKKAQANNGVINFHSLQLVENFLVNVARDMEDY